LEFSTDRREEQFDGDQQALSQLVFEMGECVCQDPMARKKRGKPGRLAAFLTYHPYV
jgi:hypothetical protein